MTSARRLAAIMAIDVAGYSRLMSEDEAGICAAAVNVPEGGAPRPLRYCTRD